MISVKKKFDNPPSALLTKNCKNKIKLSLDEKNEHKFSCYNDSEKTVLKELKNIYNDKCGYCETKLNAGFELEIEHYRPKKKVKEDSTHKGYYWLGYEWSNLLLACINCNRGIGGKGTKFPIEGKRVYNHNYCVIDGLLASKECYPLELLEKEKPLLLNPEVDEVEKHLIFLPTGEIKGLTNRGKMTIEICNLKRDELIIARKDIVDNILKEIKKDTASFIKKEIDTKTLTYSLEKIFSKILLGVDKEKAYSRVYYFIFLKFDIFILKKLGEKQKVLVEIQFNNFKNQKDKK